MSTILEKACGTLWTGSDLDEAALFAALARAGSRGVDWADLYFQHIESHDWLLEEGIVKTGHFSIDRGYGLRTIAGERQALSYGDDLVSRNLLASADDLRSLCGPRSVTMPAHFRPQAVRPLYSPDVEAVDPSREIELLRHIDRYARSLSPSVRNVTATLQAEIETVLVADLEGRLTADIRPQIYLSVNVLAEQNGRTEQGTSGGGGRCGIEHFTRDRIETWCEKAVREAVLQTEARPAPSGVMPVVLGPGWPGILLHEAVGHGLEATARKPPSLRAGSVRASPLAGSRSSTTEVFRDDAARSRSTMKERPRNARFSSKTASSRAFSPTASTPVRSDCRSPATADARASRRCRFRA